MGTTQKTLRLFWRANMRFKWLFTATAGIWLTGMILQKIIVPFIGAQAIDLLVKQVNGHSLDYWPMFLPYLAGVLALGLVALALIDLGLVLLSRLETKVRPLLRNSIFDYLMNQSLSFHANKFSGALVAQANRFTAAYVTLTDQFIITFLRMFTNVGIAIVFIAFFAPMVALAMTIWTLFFVYINVTLTRRRMKYSRAAAAADSILTGHLADAIGNIGAVKGFAGEDAEKATHSDLAYDHAAKKYRSWVAAIRNDAVIGMLMVVLYFMVLALSIYAAMEGALSIGLLLLIQVYVTQLITELWGLSNLMRQIEQAVTDAEEMTDILDEEVQVTDPAKPEKLRIQKGTIDFKDMSFTHSDDKSDTLFEDFTLHIKAGEKIGLVGHSGSGKTTLTRLLLRFSDIDAGSIEIDGQNIARLWQSDLRKVISYVPQEPILFHRSLRENIAYGKPQATLEEVQAAAERAHAAEFIEKLPLGYNTLVGERGIKLSGGQRQRIAVARAILKDAPILVLDEATSALDSESEKLIQASLKELMKKRTAIVIAHRLSTIQQMDRIVVLDNGTIAEQGSHRELLKQKGIYAELWKHQSGGFLEE
ncbi:ABC transporter-related protein [candidate division TM7 genomosp. GTL1]|nr:ABC transporter-related protein [candidate division TM7 genomosp. GTL1]